MRHLVCLLPLLVACREGTEASATQSTFVPIPTSSLDAASCHGAGLAPAAVPTPVPLATLNIGPSSQLAAEAGTQLLFATGGDGAVVQIDMSSGTPVETTIVSPGTLDALLANPLIGIATPAVLSGLCVLDAAHLAVVERTSNTILLINRLIPDTVAILAGFPNEQPGFADGPAALARFSFGATSSCVPTGDGALLVTDPGNHALRRVELASGGFVVTVAGLGTPVHNDGNISEAGFDTPSGIAIACTGELLVVESGASGNGGHRLRELRVGSTGFFGALGSVSTLAGDGVESTIGGAMASLAAPTGLLSTLDDAVFWMDASTGLLRRYSFLTELTDCPGFVDCAAATMAGGPFAGVDASLALDEVSGSLYVLDPSAATLFSL
ncbi:MAG: hypothetical protein WD226_13590 [Planctomycetota bacterium]